MFDGVYNGKRVLVTGNTGFKGSWLTIWLQMLGADVAGLSDSVPTQPSNYDICGLGKCIRQYFVDVRDFVEVENAIREFRPHMIFHLSAQALVRKSLTNPLLTFQTNTQGTVNLLEVLRIWTDPVPTVVVTSDKCYRNLEWVWGYRETDELGGNDPYSASKAAAELAFRSYVKTYENVVAATARAGNVIGGGDWAPDRIVPDCARAWLKRETPLIRHPNATRPWQHVLEPLGGYLWLGASLSKYPRRYRGESYNFGPNSGDTYSVQNLLEQMKNNWPDISWKHSETLADAAGESTLLKLNCDKAFADLRWKTLLDIEKAVQLTAEWYLGYREKLNMREFSQSQIADYISIGRRQRIVWAEHEN